MASILLRHSKSASSMAQNIADKATLASWRNKKIKLFYSHFQCHTIISPSMCILINPVFEEDFEPWQRIEINVRIILKLVHKERK